MNKKSFSIDCILIYSWEYWENHLLPDLIYDQPYLNREKVAETVENAPQLKTAEPPYTMPNTGPSEFTNTETQGTSPIHTMELALYEVCPRCDTVLQMYYVRGPHGEKVYRCKNCFLKLKKSEMGWIADEDQT